VPYTVACLQASAPWPGYRPEGTSLAATTLGAGESTLAPRLLPVTRRGSGSDLQRAITRGGRPPASSDDSLYDYWRSTDDRRLDPVAGSARALAVAHRPDGSLRHFDGAGAELTRLGRVLERVERHTDASGAVTGWTYRSAEDARESYSPEGLLLSIEHRGGVYACGHDRHHNLRTLRHPDGTLRAYHYEDARFPNALTGFTDERGERRILSGRGARAATRTPAGSGG
jgi:hypothetical protein